MYLNHSKIVLFATVSAQVEMFCLHLPIWAVCLLSSTVMSSSRPSRPLTYGIWWHLPGCHEYPFRQLNEAVRNSETQWNSTKLHLHKHIATANVAAWGLASNSALWLISQIFKRPDLRLVELRHSTLQPGSQEESGEPNGHGPMDIYDALWIPMDPMACSHGHVVSLNLVKLKPTNHTKPARYLVDHSKILLFHGIRLEQRRFSCGRLWMTNFLGFRIQLGGSQNWGPHGTPKQT